MVARIDYLNEFLQTNTFQCILATDGIMSFAIFLYADGLIQWHSSQATTGNPAHVGINAGDGVNFVTHEYSFTAQVLTITTSRVPEGVMMNGMLVYRIDGQSVISRGCAYSSDGM